MSQYADINSYKYNNAPLKKEAIQVIMDGHDNEAEIMELINECYHSEASPFNGTGETVGKHGTTYVCKARQTISSKASLPQAGYKSSWAAMTDSHKQYIRGTVRWKAGFKPETANTVKFDKKVQAVADKMAINDKYYKKMLNRHELLSMTAHHAEYIEASDIEKADNKQHVKTVKHYHSLGKPAASLRTVADIDKPAVSIESDTRPQLAEPVPMDKKSLAYRNDASYQATVAAQTWDRLYPPNKVEGREPMDIYDVIRKYYRK